MLKFEKGMEVEFTDHARKKFPSVRRDGTPCDTGIVVGNVHANDETILVRINGKKSTYRYHMSFWKPIRNDGYVDCNKLSKLKFNGCIGN